MFEHWKGGSFIRIHREGCKYSQSQRAIDPEAEHTMYFDGRYDTLEKAEIAAQQKVNRWKTCLECCQASPSQLDTPAGETGLPSSAPADPD